MNSMVEGEQQYDRTMNALFFEAARTGDWRNVEHFMLGTIDNAPRGEEE
jgi:hypothetical protein